MNALAEIEARARLGQADEAARAYREAVALAPGSVEGWRGLARTLQLLRDVPGAVDAWEHVVALAPSDWQAHNDLGAALMESGAWASAEAALASASRAAPDEPTVLVNRARLDVRRGRAAIAAAALEELGARHGELPPALAGLGFALRELGRDDDHVAALRGATALAPDDAIAACGLGRALLEAGAAGEASTVAQSYLRRRPGHAGALALEALARLALGDAEAVRRLLDYERLVARRQLPVPDGFTDLGAFNRALAAHAATRPTLVPSPTSHAAARGLHSGSPRVTDRGPVAAFERMLRAVVSDYWRVLPDLALPPFTPNRPGAGFFDMWCVVLQRGGHQVPHIHPEAWLSGVYYPQLPQLPAEIRSGTGCEGWLEFAPPDRPFPSRLRPPTLRVRPVEGLLVLFPSYLHHRTIPFEGDGTRVSVAFDFVPAR